MKIKLDPRNKLQKARRALSVIGVNIEIESLAQKATIGQIQELEELGADEAAQLMEVVQSMNSFDQLVSENLRRMNVGERYEDIRQNFESIIKDLERKVRGASGDQIMGRKMVDKIQERFVAWRRGDIKDRFNKIKLAYEGVFGDADDQIKHEMAILEAYRDYREALRDSTYIAQILKQRADDDRQGFAEKYEGAKNALEALPEDVNPLERGALQIELDNAQRDFEKADRRQDIAASLSEKLEVSYGISEAVMTRYAETTKVRENVQRQSAMFYTANQGVMNTLMATFVQLEATNEQAQTMTEMGLQTKAMLNKLSSNSSALSKIAVKAQESAYKSQITAEDIRKLYESTISFKVEQAKNVAELRKQRDRSLEEVRVEIKKGAEKMAEANLEVINTSYTGVERSSVVKKHDKVQAIEIEVPEMNADRLRKTSEAPVRKRANTP